MAKRKIEQYTHTDKDRANNPPAGLATAEQEPAPIRKTYRFDPHLSPELQFDSARGQLDSLLRDLLAGAGSAVGAALDQLSELAQSAARFAAAGQPELAAEAERLVALLKAGIESMEGARDGLRKLNDLQTPFLNWAGKAERLSFEVPTVSLHVHERIDARTIVEAVQKKNGAGPAAGAAQPDLFHGFFTRPAENPPLKNAIEFYKHPHDWSNRLIAGDSLLVMNSLLEKEGMAGKVQMIYIDPPYGIKYGSNFQPFVNKREVKDGKDEDLTSEPEMLKAFRDTWELGIHSYLTYMRDRLLLARELLTESGSVFVQISDENLHLIRGLLDETFGSRNFVSIIPFRKKTMPLGAKFIEQMNDFILWYAKEKPAAKFRRLFVEYSTENNADFNWFEAEDGKEVQMDDAFIADHSRLPENSKVFRKKSLKASGRNPSGVFTYKFQDREFTADADGYATDLEGMQKLDQAQRLTIKGNHLNYKYYSNDYPVTSLLALWNDMVGAKNKSYIVQTSEAVLQRCILMTTDPGDLVVDPTCGSGTTAVVAEQWGRRWISCDTSRVAITLAKQRLMTSVFDYYELADEERGVGGGFKYKTVPHITLGSIANNPEIREGMTREQIDRAIAKYADQETLYDQPYVDAARARVTGPFTVEAVPAPRVLSPDESHEDERDTPADASVAREGETLRQAEWRAELLRTGVRGSKKQKIEFARLEVLPGARFIQAHGETKDGQRALVAFGPEHAPLTAQQVEAAIQEAQKIAPRPDLLLFAAFQYDPIAAQTIEETNWPNLTLLRALMNADLNTEDLKKKRSSNESFWLIGRPDVMVKRLKSGADKGKYQVTVRGFDYYDIKSGEVSSGDVKRIALWMLDTDYDNRSVYPRQVFFPMAGEKEGWARLARNLKAEIDEELIEAYRGAESLPFEAGAHRRIAVKLVDDRGIESLRVINLED